MSNDASPRPPLEDPDFITIVLDPGQPISCGAQLEGGMTMSVSPELLASWKFGMKDSLPTPEADIYAFELVVFQVCEEGRGHLLSTYIV